MLKKYIEKTNINQSDFAASIGVSRGYISLLISGQKLPSLDLAGKIERETSGFVPMTSWVPDAEEAAQ